MLKSDQDGYILKPGFNHFLIVGAILVTNFILHSINLGLEGFWYDEIVSVKATQLEFGHIKHMSEWDNNPPFYYYCLWVWSKVFGIDEFAIRSLNLVFHLTSVSVLYSLVSRYLNTYLAISSTLLFSFNDFIFYYTHEARCYSLTVMLVLLSTLQFFILLRKPGYLNALILGLINFLIIYTHYISGIVLFIQAIIILIYKRSILKHYLLSILFLAILIILRFTKKQLFLILGFNNRSSDFWLQKATTDDFKTVITQLLGNSYLAYLVAIVATTSIIYIIFKRKTLSLETNVFLNYALLLSLISVISLYILGTLTPLFLGRYLIFTIPFFSFLTPVITVHSRKLSIISIFLAALTVFSIKFNLQKPTDYPLAVKVATSVKQKMHSQIVIQTKDLTSLFAYYYDLSLFKDLKNQKKRLFNDGIFEVENAKDFGELNFKVKQPVLLLQTFEKETDARLIFDLMRVKGYKSKTTNAVKGVKITLFL